VLARKREIAKESAHEGAQQRERGPEQSVCNTTVAWTNQFDHMFIVIAL